MRTFVSILWLAVMQVGVIGCATRTHSIDSASDPIAAVSTPAVVQAEYVDTKQARDNGLTSAAASEVVAELAGDAEALTFGLSELIELALERHPELEQVSWSVEAARGRALQAGLYPNPTFSVTGEDLGDRTGPSGVWSISNGQELVTANKLDLNRAAACKIVDQRTFKLVAVRYEVLTRVRQAYFQALTLQQRARILAELVQLAEQSVETARKLLKAQEAAELEVVQLEVDLERYRTELSATERALPAAYRKVAATAGVEEMSIAKLAGDLDLPPPTYDLDQVRAVVLDVHPDLQSARAGVDRARLLLRRALVEPIPNVTVEAGYTHQGQNRSHDWHMGVSVPVPAWNRNQGNIRAARAEVSEAVRQVDRVRIELSNRLASAFSAYAAAKERAQRLATAILPRADRTYQLSRKAYLGGEFEYLRVLEAQRTAAEAHLELVRSRGELWHAASEIAGLMLDDQQPQGHASLAPERQQ